MKTGNIPAGQAEKQVAEDKKEFTNDFMKFLGKGKTSFFVLPPDADSTDWKRPLYQHKFYLTGPTGESKFNSYTCPKAHGDLDCPLCELQAEYHAEGGADNLEKAKDLNPQRKFIINALIIDELDKDKLSKNIGKPTPLEIPYGVRETITSCDGDTTGGWADVTGQSSLGDNDGEHMAVRFDVDKSGKGLKTKYNCTAQPHEGQLRTSLSSIFDKYDVNIEDIELPILDNLCPPPSFDELVEVARMYKGVEPAAAPDIKPQGRFKAPSAPEADEAADAAAVGAVGIPNLPPPPGRG